MFISSRLIHSPQRFVVYSWQSFFWDREKHETAPSSVQNEYERATKSCGIEMK